MKLPAYEKWVYTLYFGPLRKVARRVLRPLAGFSDRVRLGPSKGMIFHLPDPAYRLGIYELHVQYALWQELQTQDVFYDVGANVGFFSALGSQKIGGAGQVYGFEPLPENAESMTKLIKANGCSNIHLISMAVGNSVGWAKFHSGSSGPKAALAAEGNFNVQITTLDDFTKSAALPDGVLVDVEGAEMLVLEGAQRVLREKPPRFWLIEVHSELLCGQMKKRMSEFGYDVRTLRPPVERATGYPQHILAKRANG